MVEGMSALSPMYVHVVPTDRSFLPETLRDVWKPTNLYTITSCDRCGVDAWIGPRQKSTSEALTRAGRPVIRICSVCVVRAGMSGRVGIVDLGGGHTVEGTARP